MFGLDARIALAIFGALSVISGAALYSAIQDAKTTALLAEINEIGKAWESYLLDTGTDLPSYPTAHPQHRNTLKLISDTKKGWNGPYLNYTSSSIEPLWTFGNNEYQAITMPATSNLEWGHGHANTAWSSAPIRCNDTTIPCYLTVQLIDSRANTNILSKAINLDKKVDNADGAYSGKVRWYPAGDGYVLAYIYTPYKMP